MVLILFLLLAWVAILLSIITELENEKEQWKRECIRLQIEMAKMKSKDFGKIFNEPYGTE